MLNLWKALLTFRFPSGTLALVTARRVVVKGWSMYPCLAPGEYVLCDSRAYLSQGPRRSDVVLAMHPTEPKKPLIKRVVGLPGDRVEITAGRLFINGHPLEQHGQGPEQRAPGQHQVWLLENDQYFLLGDAEFVSTDSRSFGPLPRKALQARAWLVYWPLSRWRRIT